MKSIVKFTVKDFEDDELHLELFASNRKFQACQDFYFSKEDFEKFGQKLLAFSGDKKEIVLEYGMDDPKWYCHIKIKLYSFKSSGQSAVEIMIDNHKEKPFFSRSEFSIECVPSDINRLGRMIIDWDNVTNSQIEWSI